MNLISVRRRRRCGRHRRRRRCRRVDDKGSSPRWDAGRALPILHFYASSTHLLCAFRTIRLSVAMIYLSIERPHALRLLRLGNKLFSLYICCNFFVCVFVGSFFGPCALRFAVSNDKWHAVNRPQHNIYFHCAGHFAKGVTVAGFKSLIRILKL